MNSVPSLTTALTGPLLAIEKLFIDHHLQIEHWFRHQFRLTPPPFYASVDIRNAGFKIAPVDTNLFPAGFNNLNPDFIPLLIQAITTEITQFLPSCQKLLLVPENHTRNPYYWKNIAVLYDVLLQAGYDVRVGSTLPLDQTIELSSGETTRVELIQRENDQLTLTNFIPCAILLNNDLSEGIPELFKNIKQPFIPPLKLGWSFRKKSHHFDLYEKVANEFSLLIGMDPWLIAPYFKVQAHIDFMKHEGENALADDVRELLSKISKKYDEYHIQQKPFVFIKSDSGTYGMGIMTAFDPNDVLDLNRKQRSKMAASKGGKDVSRVLLQEGIYTQETWGLDNAVAEPVVYMIGSHVVGGFYRVHKGRGANENLNAPGMQFEPLAFACACNQPRVPPCCNSRDESPNRFYAYGVIARLALLAASRELTEVK